MISISFSPTGVIFNWSQTLTNVMKVHWTQRLKMVRGGNATKQACEWHAFVVFTVLPTLSSPPRQPATHRGFSRERQPMWLLAGRTEKMRLKSSGQGVTFYLFLMERCLLTTLYVGGLAIDSQFVVLIFISWNPYTSICFSTNQEVTFDGVKVWR